MASVLPVSKLVGLLQSADPTGQMLVRVLNERLLGIGVDPERPIATIDFSTEMLTRDSAHAVVVVSHTDIGASQRNERSTGRYWYELDGKRVECRSGKAVFLGSLEAIEAKRPGTLQKLSAIKKRTKRIVAPNATELFDNKHLTKDHSVQLANGWWVGTNNSSTEAKNWLRQAIAQAGLAWGKDFRTSL